MNKELDTLNNDLKNYDESVNKINQEYTENNGDLEKKITDIDETISKANDNVGHGSEMYKTLEK